MTRRDADPIAGSSSRSRRPRCMVFVRAVRDRFFQPVRIVDHGGDAGGAQRLSAMSSFYLGFHAVARVGSEPFHPLLQRVRCHFVVGPRHRNPPFDAVVVGRCSATLDADLTLIERDDQSGDPAAF
jgi:hypothetical protein